MIMSPTAEDPEIAQATLSAVNVFADNFNRSYVMVKGFVRDTGKTVKNSTEKILHDCVSRGRVRGKPAKWPSKSQQEAMRVHAQPFQTRTGYTTTYIQ